jgi:hypothetical protein
VSAGLAAVGMTVGPSASNWWRSGYLAPLTLLGGFAVVVIALAARQLLGLQGGRRCAVQDIEDVREQRGARTLGSAGL